MYLYLKERRAVHDLLVETEDHRFVARNDLWHRRNLGGDLEKTADVEDFLNNWWSEVFVKQKTG